MRLTGFEIRREDGFTKLTLSTPSCEFEAQWQLEYGEDMEFRRELTIQLAESMRVLGREVVLEKVHY